MLYPFWAPGGECLKTGCKPFCSDCWLSKVVCVSSSHIQYPVPQEYTGHLPAVCVMWKWEYSVSYVVIGHDGLWGVSTDCCCSGLRSGPCDWAVTGARTVFWSKLYYAGTAFTFFPGGPAILEGPKGLVSVPLVRRQALAHVYWILAAYLSTWTLAMLWQSSYTWTLGGKHRLKNDHNIIDSGWMSPQGLLNTSVWMYGI